MTKQELIAELEKVDIKEQDWLDIFLDDHKTEIGQYSLGYLACLKSHLGESLSEDSLDFHEEIQKAFGYLPVCEVGG